MPSIPELGAPQFMMPTGASSVGTTGSIGSGAGGGASYAAGSTDALALLQATSFGSGAVAAAQAVGVDPAALAAFGQIESNFRNVAAANGSTSATGPWQITSGTWNDVCRQNGLNYTADDRNDPVANATVAALYMGSIADRISSGTGQPATVAQTYAGYMFGPSTGVALSNATDQSAPLSNYVSATALSNNNMTGWTVGQYFANVSGRLGSDANGAVRSG
ncbi:transglycosylase SLT domain-containing protein [Endobacter medicaginis]|uniref:Transglycosylase SLT domain-containing protein n=1 Tax=Endobacter medicaginis TaxID=1181271 RepID=A0A850NUU0_9PROT|nr:transglycosylase SLT domain-containing protein [Endobacter medicaginis]